MATRTISTKLAVEGEAEYKKAIAACNAENSTLKSNLAAVESSFRGNANTMSALTAKGTALSSMYEAQKNKVSTLEAALANAQKSQEQYAERVSTARENVERCERALEELKNSTGDTTEEQKALTEELEKWNSELSEAQGYEDAAARGVQNWQKQLNYANVDLDKLSDQVEENNRLLEEASESADGCASSIDGYGKKTKEAGEESGKFGNKSKDAINQLSGALAAAGVTAAIKEITEALLACSAAAETFEAAIAKVATIADTSSMSLEEIQTRIITLSGETGKSAASLSEAVYSAISAGVDTASAVEFVEKATRLAAGGFTEAETAVDVLTTALNAYGLSVEETERISDILITTQNLGKTTVDQLAQSVGKVIPLASAYNVEMDNLGAAYAVLTAGGVATAEAGTYLKAMLTELGDSGSTVAGVLRDQTGKSFSALMAGGASLGDVLAILGDSVDGDSTAFNELWSSTEAGVGALSIFGRGAENFNGVLSSMQDSAGATASAYSTMADTTEFAHQRMTTAVENLKIAIGTELNPALETLYSTGASAFEWATDFVQENPWVVSAITALVAGISTLAVGLTIAANAANIATIATAAWNAVLAANPVGLVVAGVVALAAAVTAFILCIGSADKETRAFCDSLKETKDAYDELSEAMDEERASTEAMVSALESALAVEEKSEAQKSAILEMVNQLNEAVPGLGLAYDTATDSINMTTESLNALTDAAANQEEYEAQVARLSELYVEQAEIEARLEEAQTKYNEAVDSGAWGTGKLKNNVDALNEELESNREQIAALEKESAAYGEWQAASATATKEMSATVGDLVSEMEALQESYTKAHDEAKKSIEGQLGLFNELDGSAKTSIDNLISTLKGQVDYMDTYAENINKAMELGVDEGLIKKLSDGSEESAQILAAIVQGGEDDIAALNEQLAKVEEGKENFSSTVAEMETDFSDKMDDLEERLGKTIEELDVSVEAGAAGAATIQGYIDGAEGMRTQLQEKYKSLAKAANRAWKDELVIRSPSRVFREDGQNTIKGAILGGEDERANLESTYSSLGSSAGDKFSEALSGSYEAAQTAARKSVDAQIGTFKEMDTKAGASVNSLIKTLKGQVAYMDTYAVNIKKAVELGVNEGLVKQLSDGSEESSKILASIVEGGKEKVDELNEQLARVEEGKNAFASTIAEMETATTGATERMTQTVGDLVSEMGELQKAYEDSYNSAYRSIDGQLGLLTKVSGTISTTGNVSDLIFGLNDQANFLEGYNSLIEQALERGVNKEIVAQLADGSEKSAQELLKIVAGTDGQITALNNNFERVKEGKEKFSSTIAEMETDFSEKMTSLEERIGETVGELNVSIEAAAAGADTIEGYIEGAESKREALIAKYKELATAANNAYKSTLSTGTGYAAASSSAVSAERRATPSSTVEPSKNAAQQEQTAAIVQAITKTDKSGRGGPVYVTINSPKALDEKATAREFKKVERNRALGIV